MYDNGEKSDGAKEGKGGSKRVELLGDNCAADLDDCELGCGDTAEEVEVLVYFAAGGDCAQQAEDGFAGLAFLARRLGVVSGQGRRRGWGLWEEEGTRGGSKGGRATAERGGTQPAAARLQTSKRHRLGRTRLLLLLSKLSD